MVLLSVLLNFFMEFQAQHAVEEIRKEVATTAAVMRDGREQEMPVAELVPGDIIRLNAGDLVPADARLLEVKDLQVRESALTGESLPVEKTARDLPAGKHTVADASNCVFMGTAVQTGIGTAVIVCTGRNTALGEIAQRLATRPPETEFGRGIRHFAVVVRHGDECLLVTKGEAESVFAICQTVTIDGSPQPFDESRRTQAAETFQKLSADGFRVLGVAARKVHKQDTYTLALEKDMTLAGFAAFLDPPKEGILSILEALKQNGVSVVIMTGDNQYVTQKIAHDVGIKTDRIITGSEVDTMDDPALAYQAENGAIFARVSPEQKNRVIVALKARGHVVGYIGDGINDAPSLHTADVGISVMNGVDVAKDAAKIILLEKDLAVLNDGIIEGRRCFANIMKYIVMGTSSNFGNMFSMAAASVFLPFLPMLPTQILLNNFLYDVSQISIPTDNVDPALLQSAKAMADCIHSPVHDDHRAHQLDL